MNVFTKLQFILFENNIHVIIHCRTGLPNSVYCVRQLLWITEMAFCKCKFWSCKCSLISYVCPLINISYWPWECQFLGSNWSFFPFLAAVENLLAWFCVWNEQIGQIEKKIFFFFQKRCLESFYNKRQTINFIIIGFKMLPDWEGGRESQISFSSHFSTT